jgi:hypothetical protein
MRMIIRTCSLRDANAYVAQWHRHCRPTVGHKFSLAVVDADGGGIHGVAIVGRPVARGLDDGLTLEVNRVATDGTRNACSMLYGAARRAARELGYARIVTYILESEPGTSLRAAGWRLDGHIPQHDGWTNRPGRAEQLHLNGVKQRWAGW